MLEWCFKSASFVTWEPQSLESKSNTNKTGTFHFTLLIPFIYHFLLSAFVRLMFCFFLVCFLQLIWPRRLSRLLLGSLPPSETIVKTRTERKGEGGAIVAQEETKTIKEKYEVTEGVAVTNNHRRRAQPRMSGGGCCIISRLIFGGKKLFLKVSRLFQYRR